MQVNAVLLVMNKLFLCLHQLMLHFPNLINPFSPLPLETVFQLFQSVYILHAIV